MVFNVFFNILSSLEVDRLTFMQPSLAVRGLHPSTIDEWQPCKY
jgi:hypothetical protein